MGVRTIRELHAELVRQIEKGNGDKKILLSNDDEGNGYHAMYYLVSPVDGNISDEYQLSYGVTLDEAKKNYLILG